MSRVLVAAGSKIAADAGAAIAETGGNAVDAAIAAALMLMISEPGVCAPGAGGFITIRSPGTQPVTIDANVSMPGLGAPPHRFGHHTREATMEYGGGVTTIVGYESIATPGGIAGLGRASELAGRAPWNELVEPSVELTRSGVPMTAASHLYLGFSHDAIFGWHPTSKAAIHYDDGRLYDVGEKVFVPGLTDSLEQIGTKGWSDLYRGELARVLTEDLDSGGSLVTLEDLAAVEPIVRTSIGARIGDWTIYSSPPPSIGGSTLVAMLELASRKGSQSVIERLISSQGAVLRYRRDFLDEADNLDTATRTLLDSLAEGDGLDWMSSPSTVHASAVSDDGTACSITMSAGYGSGVVAGSTGLWMNNSLGEAELNCLGFHGLPVGAVLPSNMAPTVGVRDDGAVLSVGSPGADRITTALQQVITSIVGGMSPQDAVDAPRLHIEPRGESVTVAYETGLDIPDTYVTRRFDQPHMFFGGVAAAMFDPDLGFRGAADGRRTGAMAIAG